MAFNPEFPPRLSDGDDPHAELIRRALAEPAPGPSEQRSWQRLRSRSKPSKRRFLLSAVAAGLVLTALALWLDGPRPDLSLNPETLAQHAAPPRAIASAATSSPAAAVTGEKRKPLHVAPSPSVTASAGALAKDADTAPCAKLAKESAYAEATACYARIAQGSRMTSELALYEKARLEAKALGNRALALSTLDEHTRRFPSGVLANEVALTRIDLLSQLGRRTEALTAIDRSLKGALGRERAGDLQVMRAGLLAANQDCAAALAAARAARQAGVHPSRLEAVEHRCSSDTPTPSPADAP